jgi:hypothetical protein
MRLIYPNIKKIKINHEIQFSIDLILNDEIRKKIQYKKDIKNNLTQLGLTCQTLLLGIEAEIT